MTDSPRLSAFREMSKIAHYLGVAPRASAPAKSRVEPKLSKADRRPLAEAVADYSHLAPSRAAGPMFPVRRSAADQSTNWDRVAERNKLVRRDDTR